MNVDGTWLELMKLGAKSFSVGNFNEAIAFFQKAVDLSPIRGEGWANLSSALSAYNQLPAALEAIEEAIHLDPNVMACYMIKGDILRDLHNAEGALDAYLKAVSLRRDPHSINRLAWAMRKLYRFQEAEQLYMEAIRLDPKFNLARINLASLSLIMGKHDACGSLLKEIDITKFTKAEHNEYSAIVALYKEYLRHLEPINELVVNGNQTPLLAELRKSSEFVSEIDQDMFEKLKLYSEIISSSTFHVNEKKMDLPDNWDVIEALFMIPYIDTPLEYGSALMDLEDTGSSSVDVLETKNMIAAIGSARAKRTIMSDPIVAEHQLRCWHSLACKNVPGLMPGHFKYSQNRVISREDIARVNPLKTAATFRAFITEIYQHVQPGMPRAILVLMAVCDMHPFADGNARTAFIWLNRELEWAGLMPALFNSELNLKGELGKAMIQVRANPDNFTPLALIIQKGQIFARHFCEQLASMEIRSPATKVSAPI